MPTPADVTATFCATFVDELVRAGVRDAVVCPGSRSTPMALALVADGRVRVHVHTDERSAAFLALGIAIERGVPAPVLTTSGTAAVELHPAMVEAHHAKVPMLALTADRPAELHGVGAPQTIDQSHLFGSSVRAFHDPGVPDDAGRETWRRTAARVVADTIGPPAGPVQCNLAFREPLVGTAAPLPPGRDLGAPWIGHGAPADADPDTVAALADAVAGRRGVVVAGGGIEHPDGVLDLAEVLGWPVLADPRSGCRRPGEHVIAHADGLLRHARFAGHVAPDVVLRCGELPASRVVGEWLAAQGAAWQVGIEADGATLDPWGSLASVIAAEPGALCAAVARALEAADGDVRAPQAWAACWAQADAECAQVLVRALGRDPDLAEVAVARAVVGAVPAGGRLVVSSSMPIRDVEWYAPPRAGLRVLANRGTNGIDGVVSTAIGVAVGADVPTVALVGDLAFLHDTNGLLGAGHRPADCTIVIVDNDGGGIFEHLPQAASLDADVFEQLFGTPHGLDLAAVAAAHGIAVTVADDAEQVGAAVREAAGTPGVRAVVVRSDRRAGAAARSGLHRAMGTALDAMLDAAAG